MILYFNICLKEVSELKKKFKWKIKRECPKCKGKFWGHGYRVSYSDSMTIEEILKTMNQK
ncbi:MAG: hypothetical protein ABIA04_02490 [Pseudomonadota bacterium]